MSARLLPLVVGLTTASLALGYGLAGLWLGLILCLGVGAAWLAGFWYRWPWMPDSGLVVCAGLAAVGMGLGLGAVWMLMGLVAALAAWDLDHLARRVAAAGRVQDRPALERRHVERLAILSGLGLLLGLIPLWIELRLTFLSALILGLAAIVGLSRAFRSFWDAD